MDNEAPVEFDSFADEYASVHQRNVGFTGETPEYFARYKIEELHRRWSGSGRPVPRNILDFGCGVGTSLPHLRAFFPDSRIAGIDVSPRSLDRAKALQLPNVALHHYDGDTIPLAPHSQDLIFSACVFHHIEPGLRPALFRQLHGLLRPGGALVIFEHNPLNPVTQYIVATCVFDENAVLLSARELARLQRDAGFAHVRARFTGFFPARLAKLRRFEGLLARIPLGAQYYTMASA